MLVDDLPGADGVPLLRGRGLEADVVAAAVGHRARELRRPSPSRRWSRPCRRSCARSPRASRSARPTACARSTSRGTISRHCLAMPAHAAGSVRRPVLSVTSAILRPLPSSPIRFSRGTRTSLKLIDAVGERLQAHEAAAVLDLHARPVGLDDEGADLLGLAGRAPSRPAARRACRSCTRASRRSGRRCRPSRSAVVERLAGSEPTCGSVSANAEIAPAAQRGRYFFFCSGVPKSLSGCGTPIDWCAESSALMLPS